MPKIGPLDPLDARATLANRFGPLADRMRQFNTNFGLRPSRVFLVWTHWTGEERGEGDEHVVARVELLPTPRVADMSSQMRRYYSVGHFAEGAMRVDEISTSFTRDQLVGLCVPSGIALNTCGGCCGSVGPRGDVPVHPSGPTYLERATDHRIDFWWEIVEDGRGDAVPTRQRYRVAGEPARGATPTQWAVNLERASEALSREGKPQIGNDAVMTNLNEDDF